MILAYYWSLIHGIDFVLCSKYSNISFVKGWQDYFIPYFREANFSLDVYNTRREFVPYRKKDIIKLCIYKLYCKIKGFSLTTKDIFWKAHRMNVNERNSVEGLLPEDVVSENCRRLNSLIWRFNEETKNAINKNRKKINICGDYISAHIRKGDKTIEADDTPIDIYIDKMRQITDIRNCFVFTDDYSVILDLNKKFPD